MRCKNDAVCRALRCTSPRQHHCRYDIGHCHGCLVCRSVVDGVWDATKIVWVSVEVLVRSLFCSQDHCSLCFTPLQLSAMVRGLPRQHVSVGGGDGAVNQRWAVSETNLMLRAHQWRCWCCHSSVSRLLQSMEHCDAALLTDATVYIHCHVCICHHVVDGLWTAMTWCRCQTVSGGPGKATLWQLRLLQSVKHSSVALLTDATVDHCHVCLVCHRVVDGPWALL